MKGKNKFVWGAATASYQIEGGAEQDGKGPSIWDMFCKEEGRVKNGDTGDVACDHYNRSEEDVALMRELGLQAYRFSVSWPRVLPKGGGKVNRKGLDFYDRLTDMLLKNNIEPWITLYHWDLPYELHLKGGWLNPDIVERFADYAGVVVEKLSDRAGHWMTFNEPQGFVNAGHSLGMHAPGLKLAKRDVLSVVRNVLLSHGMAVSRIREASKTKALIGTANTGPVSAPASEAKEDVRAAKAAMFRADTLQSFSLYGDPMILGRMPESEMLSKFMPEMPPEDMRLVSQPLDFYGFNCYHASTWRADEKTGEPVQVEPPAGYDKTALGWPVTPECMCWGCKFMAERYKLPIVITENGMANADVVSSDGKVHDPQRISYMQRYFAQMRRAMDEGVDIRGYFHWTFTDNFEWAEGYAARFGLVHVDYKTLKRTPKDSALWYRDHIREAGRP